MTPLDQIRAETDRIHTACDEIERVIVTEVATADGWRAALGLVEGASRRTYQLRTALLTEAMRRADEYQETT